MVFFGLIKKVYYFILRGDNLTIYKFWQYFCNQQKRLKKDV